MVSAGEGGLIMAPAGADNEASSVLVHADPLYAFKLWLLYISFLLVSGCSIIAILMSSSIYAL